MGNYKWGPDKVLELIDAVLRWEVEKHKGNVKDGKWQWVAIQLFTPDEEYDVVRLGKRCERKIAHLRLTYEDYHLQREIRTNMQASSSSSVKLDDPVWRKMEEFFTIMKINTKHSTPALVRALAIATRKPRKVKNSDAQESEDDDLSHGPDLDAVNSSSSSVGSSHGYPDSASSLFPTPKCSSGSYCNSKASGSQLGPPEEVRLKKLPSTVRPPAAAFPQIASGRDHSKDPDKTFATFASKVNTNSKSSRSGPAAATESQAGYRTLVEHIRSFSPFKSDSRGPSAGQVPENPVDEIFQPDDLPEFEDDVKCWETFPISSEPGSCSTCSSCFCTSSSSNSGQSTGKRMNKIEKIHSDSKSDLRKAPIASSSRTLSQEPNHEADINMNSLGKPTSRLGQYRIDRFKTLGEMSTIRSNDQNLPQQPPAKLSPPDAFNLITDSLLNALDRTTSDGQSRKHGSKSNNSKLEALPSSTDETSRSHSTTKSSSDDNQRETWTRRSPSPSPSPSMSSPSASASVPSSSGHYPDYENPISTSKCRLGNTDDNLNLSVFINLNKLKIRDSV